MLKRQGKVRRLRENVGGVKGSWIVGSSRVKLGTVRHLVLLNSRVMPLPMTPDRTVTSLFPDFNSQLLQSVGRRYGPPENGLLQGIYFLLTFVIVLITG